MENLRTGRNVSIAAIAVATLLTSATAAVVAQTGDEGLIPAAFGAPLSDFSAPQLSNGHVVRSANLEAAVKQSTSDAIGNAVDQAKEAVEKEVGDTGKAGDKVGDSVDRIGKFAEDKIDKVKDSDDPKAQATAVEEIVDKVKNEVSECFPGDATVELRSGETRKMRDLTIGDSVRVGPARFSEVFLFTHKTADVDSLFVNIGTKSGASLRLTPGHFIHVNGAPVPAKEAAVGHSVQLASGQRDEIDSVVMTPDTGLYNPQTLDGNIVVDGILVSTFTTAVEPRLAHAALFPLRTAFRWFGFSSNMLEGGAPDLGSLVYGK